MAAADTAAVNTAAVPTAASKSDHLSVSEALAMHLIVFARNQPCFVLGSVVLMCRLHRDLLTVCQIVAVYMIGPTFTM